MPDSALALPGPDRSATVSSLEVVTKCFADDFRHGDTLIFGALREPRFQVGIQPDGFDG